MTISLALEGESDLTFLTIAKLTVKGHSNHQPLCSHLHNIHIYIFPTNDTRQCSMFDVTSINKWPESIPGDAIKSLVTKLHSMNRHIVYLLVRSSNYNTLFYKLLSKACTRVHTSYTEYVSLSPSNGRARIESSKKVSSIHFSLADSLQMPKSDYLTPELQSSSEELKQ
jgi:hypothetical protein